MRPRTRNNPDSSRPSSSGNRRRSNQKNNNINSSRRGNKDQIFSQRGRSKLTRKNEGYEDFSEQTSFEDHNGKKNISRSNRILRTFGKRSDKGKGLNYSDSSVTTRTPEGRSNRAFRDTNRSTEKGFESGNKFIRNKNQSEDLNRRLEEQKETRDIFWGRHTTQAILESGRPLHRIWCTTELRSSQRFLQLLKDAKSLGVLVEEVSWARLGHLTCGGVHQGIALQTAASETLDLNTLIDGCKSINEKPVLLALDGLTDPHNLGAIVRSAEALGAHGIVLPQRRSAGLTGSVAKVAAGALEHLPVARVVNLNRSLEALKKVGYTIIGLAEEGSETINQFDIQGPLVVVIGSEDKGLSVLTRRNCDKLIRIPLRGVTSSLNASVATSIFLYEVAKKSWMSGISGNAPSPKLERAKLSRDF